MRAYTDVRPEDLEHARPPVREITMRVRALQEQGALIVATQYHDYYALPQFYALSGVRGDRWQGGVVERKDIQGRLRAVEVTAEGQRGVFWVFQPRDGENLTLADLPEDWPIPRRPIEPAVVTFDVVRQRAVVQGEISGDMLLLNDLPPGTARQVFDHITHQMADGLRSDRRTDQFVGNHLVPWKVIVQVPDNPPWYPLAPVPYLRNDQVSITLTGFAARQLSYTEAVLVYAGVVGHKTALESIRASVQGRTRRRLSISRYNRRLDVTGEYLWAQTDIPEEGLHHGALLLRDALDPRGKDVGYILIYEGEDTRPQDMLISVLDVATTLPFLPEWADVLWVEALDRGWVEELDYGGDVVAAYAVHLTKPWDKLLSMLVAAGRLTVEEGA